LKLTLLALPLGMPLGECWHFGTSSFFWGIKRASLCSPKVSTSTILHYPEVQYPEMASQKSAAAMPLYINHNDICRRLLVMLNDGARPLLVIRPLGKTKPIFEFGKQIR
jgi:hypothetical protein